MVSNNAGDQIDPAIEAAADAGIRRQLGLADPVGEGESLFVAQVDFDETGKVMADMAVDILGDDGGEFADPVGVARRRQPERLDRVARGGARRARSTPRWSSSTRCTATTTPTSRTTRRWP